MQKRRDLLKVLAFLHFRDFSYSPVKKRDVNHTIHVSDYDLTMKSFATPNNTILLMDTIERLS